MATFATPTKKRSCNYTTDGDEAVTCAYMAVCTDPIIGSDQRADKFSEGIFVT